MGLPDELYLCLIHTYDADMCPLRKKMISISKLRKSDLVSCITEREVWCQEEMNELIQEFETESDMEACLMQDIERIAACQEWQY